MHAKFPHDKSIANQPLRICLRVHDFVYDSTYDFAYDLHSSSVGALCGRV
jgi:hypothetical protein